MGLMGWFGSFRWRHRVKASSRNTSVAPFEAKVRTLGYLLNPDGSCVNSLFKGVSYTIAELVKRTYSIVTSYILLIPLSICIVTSSEHQLLSGFDRLVRWSDLKCVAQGTQASPRTHVPFKTYDYSMHRLCLLDLNRCLPNREFVEISVWCWMHIIIYKSY